MKEVLALSRWREYIGFVAPLTILGSILAIKSTNGFLDYRLVLVFLGNFGAVAYAFMLNDIEDAQDDARDPHKKQRNPVSANKISKTQAYSLARATAAATLAAYLLAGGWVLWIGLFTLVLSHLYSWRVIRLKAWPVVDILSHSLMLSGLLILAGYYTYAVDPGVVWFVVAGATLFSVYGQLYNQLRDFTVDKKAKLKNTTILLGYAKTQLLLYLSLVFGAVSIGLAAFEGVFPIWLAGILVIGIVIGKQFQTKTHIGGTAVIDVTGSYQAGAVIALNLTAFTWLAVELTRQLVLGLI